MEKAFQFGELPLDLRQALQRAIDNEVNAEKPQALKEVRIEGISIKYSAEEVSPSKGCCCHFKDPDTF
jgi:hypothetical protein